MPTVIATAIVPFDQEFNNVASVLRDLGAKFYIRTLENAESQREIQFSTITADAQTFIDALVVAHASSESEVPMAEAEEETAQLEAQTEAKNELVEEPQQEQETISYYSSSALQPLTIQQMRKLAKAQEIEIPADVKKKPQLVKFLAGKLKS